MSEKKSKSKEKVKEYKKSEKEKTIELVFPENLLKSLNKMYEKQNEELMKVVSAEKNIPLSDILKFVYQQETVSILQHK